MILSSVDHDSSTDRHDLHGIFAHMGVLLCQRQFIKIRRAHELASIRRLESVLSSSVSSKDGICVTFAASKAVHGRVSDAAISTSSQATKLSSERSTGLCKRPFFLSFGAVRYYSRRNISFPPAPPPPFAALRGRTVSNADL